MIWENKLAAIEMNAISATLMRILFVFAAAFLRDYEAQLRGAGGQQHHHQSDRTPMMRSVSAELNRLAAGDMWTGGDDWILRSNWLNSLKMVQPMGTMLRPVSTTPSFLPLKQFIDSGCSNAASPQHWICLIWTKLQQSSTIESSEPLLNHLYPSRQE